MFEPLDPLDRAFDSLRSQRAVLSDSASQRLEDRIMHEQKRRGTGRTLRLFLAAAAILALLGGGVVTYGATDGWFTFPWSISIDESGAALDESGEVIGVSMDHDDGSSTTMVKMGEGHIIIQANESLKGKSLHTVVEP
jgi:hypothetical protein